MRETMKAYRIAAAEHMEETVLPVPEPEEDEVLLRMLVCGVCSSELYSYKNFTVPGKVYGHEGVGIVEKVGSRVANFQVGDRVTGMMWRCFAQYTTAKAAYIVKVPEALGDLEAVGEPLADLMSGVLRTPLDPGDSFAIVGTGYMGLGFMQMMRAKGAAKIVAVDTRGEGLENAARFGATETYLAGEVPSKYIVNEWDDHIFERGVQTVAEATGAQQALTLAGDMTGVHGTLSVVGFHQGGPRTIAMNLWNWKALTVINAHERRMEKCPRFIESALNLVAAGKLNTRDMMTNEYGFDGVDQAYHDLMNKPKGYIKGVVRIGER